MIDNQHLHALELHLSNERTRLAGSKTASESRYRQVLVAQLEKEIADERKFLGISEPMPINQIDDDELLNELFQ